MHHCPLPGERVTHDGSFISRRAPGEGSVASRGGNDNSLDFRFIFAYDLI
jgi:hypothetical protein